MSLGLFNSQLGLDSRSFWAVEPVSVAGSESQTKGEDASLSRKWSPTVEACQFSFDRSAVMPFFCVVFVFLLKLLKPNRLQIPPLFENTHSCPPRPL